MPKVRKVNSQMRESIVQGLTSPSILGVEAVFEQQLYQIFLFEVSIDWFLQEEENMAQPVAYASKDVGNIMYYHEAIN